DVGLDARGIEANAGQPREPVGQPPRVDVIVGQTLDVMPERVDAAGGDDAGLAHGTAHLLLAAPRLVDECARAGHGRADGRAEAPTAAASYWPRGPSIERMLTPASAPGPPSRSGSGARWRAR